MIMAQKGQRRSLLQRDFLMQWVIKAVEIPGMGNSTC